MNVFYTKARQILFAVLLLQPTIAFAESEPVLETYAPLENTIPANTLRLYLSFSVPMARGQVRDVIRLLHSDGHLIENPFLNLGTELWDREQRRLTLLFDPGRLKQGVGPNNQVGAPLIEGETYQLVIDGKMKSAIGLPLGDDQIISYSIIGAERRPISLADWVVTIPQSDSREPLSLSFNRLMDSAAASHMIRVVNTAGKPIKGRVDANGRNWNLTPDEPWAAGDYKIRISSELEDVSGNTIHAPFDANAGTIGQKKQPAELGFQIQ